MKKAILMATGAAVAAGFSGVAAAVDVDLYGQVNKSVMAYDDGRDTETNFVDNDKASTRFGLRGSQALDNGLTASVLYEFESRTNRSNSVTQGTTTNLQSTSVDNQGTGVTQRHARVGLGGDFGTVLLGFTSSSTDGIAEIDLAGVDDLMGSTAEKFGDALQYRTAAGAVTGVTVGNTYSSFDGGRGNAIAYVTPSYNGLQGSITAIQGGTMDAAVRYGAKYNGYEVKAGVGYVADNDNQGGSPATGTAINAVENTWVSSVSVKHDSGLAGTLAYATQSLQDKATNVDDPSSIYLKVGYSWDAFSVAADYGKTTDLDGSGTIIANSPEAKAVGLGAQYDMGNGVSLSAMWRQFDLDDNTSTNFDEINLWVANMRVKF